MDLAIAVDTTLTDQLVQVVDTTLKGPLGHKLSTLLLGHSSTTRQGNFVLPRVIDSDYVGIIKVMIYTLTPPASIPAVIKIAQLVPFKACVPASENKVRGAEGFGSTGAPEIPFAA